MRGGSQHRGRVLLWLEAAIHKRDMAVLLFPVIGKVLLMCLAFDQQTPFCSICCHCVARPKVCDICLIHYYSIQRTAPSHFGDVRQTKAEAKILTLWTEHRRHKKTMTKRSDGLYSMLFGEGVDNRYIIRTATRYITINLRSLQHWGGRGYTRHTTPINMKDKHILLHCWIIPLLLLAATCQLPRHCLAFQSVPSSVVVFPANGASQQQRRRGQGAFQHHQMMKKDPTVQLTITRHMETRLGLYLDQDDDNKSMKLEKEEESEDKKDTDHTEQHHQQQSKMMIPTTTTTKKNTEEKDEPSPLSSDTQNIIGSIFTAATNLYSLFIIGFATIVGCGLILHIMGYGYHFDLQQGRLVIDTIEQMRTDRQLQQELTRVTSTASTTGIQQIPQTKPFSITEFFFHRPFFTTLLITGVVLGVDTWFSSTTGNSNKNKDDR